jgi:hypothetical protein
MITPPSDADLERLLVETQKRSPGRVDIDRDELLVVISLLRDARGWIFALRVKAGDRTLAPKCACTYEAGDSDCAKHLTCPNCGERLAGTRITKHVDALIREADRMRRDLAAALAERDDAHKLADLWRAANSSALAECERLKSALDVVETETAERIAKYVSGFSDLAYVANKIESGAWRKP